MLNLLHRAQIAQQHIRDMVATAKDSSTNTYLNTSMNSEQSRYQDDYSNKSADSFWDDCFLADSDSDGIIMDEQDEEHKTNSP